MYKLVLYELVHVKSFKKANLKGSTKCRPIEFVPSVIVDGLLKGKKIHAPLFVVGV